MVGLVLSPFLNIGVMLAVSQSSGKLLEFKDWVNITVKIGAISSQQYLSTQAGILSGPHDLDESKVDSKFLTLSADMVTLCSDGMAGPQHSGTLDKSSLVNIDWNCLLRISAWPSEWCTMSYPLLMELFHWYLDKYF